MVAATARASTRIIQRRCNMAARFLANRVKMSVDLQMKKLLIPLLGLVGTVLFLISCGGGGNAAPLTRTGKSVQNMLRFSYLSMANSGLGFGGFGFGGGGGTTGSGTSGTGTTGGGGSVGGSGISSIGGFIRNFGGPGGIGPSMVKRHPMIEGTTGGSGTD